MAKHKYEIWSSGVVPDPNTNRNRMVRKGEYLIVDEKIPDDKLSPHLKYRGKVAEKATKKKVAKKKVKKKTS